MTLDGGAGPENRALATRRAFLWVASVMIVVVVAALTAFLLVILFGEDDAPATAEAAPPAVHASAVLRSAPAADTAITARLEAGTEVRILGRNVNADWLFVESIARTEDRGWIETAAVEPAPPTETIAVWTQFEATSTAGDPMASPTATAGQPTFTPDLPDLRVDSVFARDNRVTVVLSNVGVVDVVGEILISIDGGEPRSADIKPGEPLRPDDQLEIRIDDEYVQRRAVIRVEVLTDPPIEEEDQANNSFETVISPDVPNDLGISSVRFDGPAASLRVLLWNNSTIPITGSATITVRGRSEDRPRLGTAQPTFQLAPGAELAVDFPGIVALTIDDIEVRLASNAVNDADPTNDVFPQ